MQQWQTESAVSWLTFRCKHWLANAPSTLVAVIMWNIEVVRTLLGKIRRQETLCDRKHSNYTNKTLKHTMWESSDIEPKTFSSGHQNRIPYPRDGVEW